MVESSIQALMDAKLSKSIRRDYNELLERVEWKEFSKEIIESCPSCWWCGSEDKLEVHHRIYYEGRLPWEYHSSELMVLCHRCHFDIHALSDKCWVYLIGLDPEAIRLMVKFLETIDRSEPRCGSKEIIEVLRTHFKITGPPIFPVGDGT